MSLSLPPEDMPGEEKPKDDLIDRRMRMALVPATVALMFAGTALVEKLAMHQDASWICSGIAAGLLLVAALLILITGVQVQLRNRKEQGADE